MGLTHVKAKVANPANPRKTANLTFLVGSGAVYSIVPGETLRRLGNELPRSKLTGYQTNRESLTQLSPPHVSSGGLVLNIAWIPAKSVRE